MRRERWRTTASFSRLDQSGRTWIDPRPPRRCRQRKEAAVPGGRAEVESLWDPQEAFERPRVAFSPQVTPSEPRPHNAATDANTGLTYTAKRRVAAEPLLQQLYRWIELDICEWMEPDAERMPATIVSVARGAHQQPLVGEQSAGGSTPFRTERRWHFTEWHFAVSQAHRRPISSIHRISLPCSRARCSA